MSDSNWLISGLNIYSEQGCLPSGAVHIRNQNIEKVFAHIPTNFKGRTLVFPENYHLVPGFIDLHIHGANGADVMDASPEALNHIRLALAQEGVTRFLATTITETPERISQALKNINQYVQNSGESLGAKIQGVHLEGPFISPRHIGAHRNELLLKPDLSLFDRWQKEAGGLIKLVTLAPELSGALEFIKYLSEQGVIASIGHTDADLATTQLAIAEGASYATHLFNAMRAFHHREPGCIGAILTSEKVMAELIADGLHVHPSALHLALKAKGLAKVLLVTDAMRAKCCQNQESFDLGGQEVIVKEGAARLANGVLAGSILTMIQALKNMIRFTGYSLLDMINLTSINQAKALKIYQKVGSISIDKLADLVVLNEQLEVVLTMAQGQIIHFPEASLYERS